MITPQQTAFLTLIADCEGTGSGPEAYHALFGWTPTNHKIFESFADHPRQRWAYTDHSGRLMWTTAAGRYQITLSTYLDAKLRYPKVVTDFTPDTQDAIALILCNDHKALPAIEAGDLGVAMQLLRGVWASLPTAAVAQPHRTVDFAEQAFVDAGGRLA